MPAGIVAGVGVVLLARSGDRRPGTTGRRNRRAPRTPALALVGLLSEEWDPQSGRQLGNTPQAFSHFALVVSALQLHTRRHHRSDHVPPTGAPR